MLFLLVFDFFDFSVLARRMAGKSIPEMIYFVLSGMQHLNSILSYTHKCFICRFYSRLYKICRHRAHSANAIDTSIRGKL